MIVIIGLALLYYAAEGTSLEEERQSKPDAPVTS